MAAALPLTTTTTTNSSSSSSSSSSRSDWKQGERLGAGRFGTVFKCLNSWSGALFAIKKVPIDKGMSEARVHTLLKEVGVLSRLDHPNIIRYYGADVQSNTLSIILEYVSGGTLEKRIAEFGPLNDNIVCIYTRQLLQGLHYLHGEGVVHRDIKPANILIDVNGIVKLADFGCSEMLSELSASREVLGTPSYMAPEIVRHQGLGPAADVWALGCTVLEASTGASPWPSDHAVETVLFLLRRGNAPPVSDSVSDELKAFIKECLVVDHKVRANAEKLLQHPFIMESMVGGAMFAAAGGAGGAGGGGRLMLLDDLEDESLGLAELLQYSNNNNNNVEMIDDWGRLGGEMSPCSSSAQSVASSSSIASMSSFPVSADGACVATASPSFASSSCAQSMSTAVTRKKRAAGRQHHASSASPSSVSSPTPTSDKEDEHNGKFRRSNSSSSLSSVSSLQSLPPVALRSPRSSQLKINNNVVNLTGRKRRLHSFAAAADGEEGEEVYDNEGLELIMEEQQQQQQQQQQQGFIQAAAAAAAGGVASAFNTITSHLPLRTTAGTEKEENIQYLQRLLAKRRAMSPPPFVLWYSCGHYEELGMATDAVDAASKNGHRHADGTPTGQLICFGPFDACREYAMELPKSSQQAVMCVRNLFFANSSSAVEAAVQHLEDMRNALLFSAAKRFCSFNSPIVNPLSIAAARYGAVSAFPRRAVAAASASSSSSMSPSSSSPSSSSSSSSASNSPRLTLVVSSASDATTSADHIRVLPPTRFSVLEHHVFDTYKPAPHSMKTIAQRLLGQTPSETSPAAGIPTSSLTSSFAVGASSRPLLSVLCPSSYLFHPRIGPSSSSSSNNNSAATTHLSSPATTATTQPSVFSHLMPRCCIRTLDDTLTSIISWSQGHGAGAMLGAFVGGLAWWGTYGRKYDYDMSKSSAAWARPEPPATGSAGGENGAMSLALAINSTFYSNPNGSNTNNNNNNNNRKDKGFSTVMSWARQRIRKLGKIHC